MSYLKNNQIAVDSPSKYHWCRTFLGPMTWPLSSCFPPAEQCQGCPWFKRCSFCLGRDPKEYSFWEDLLNSSYLSGSGECQAPNKLLERKQGKFQHFPSRSSCGNKIRKRNHYKQRSPWETMATEMEGVGGWDGVCVEWRGNHFRYVGRHSI